MVDLHNEGLTNVGTVYQGRLFRTLDDIDYLEQKLGSAADYRICKGIYLEPEDIAHIGYDEIVSATNASIDKMLAAGAYCAVASHDKPVINHALSALEHMVWVQILQTQEKMLVNLDLEKVLVMSSKCCWV